MTKMTATTSVGVREADDLHRIIVLTRCRLMALILLCRHLDP
jgi:hypothetical protein